MKTQFKNILILALVKYTAVVDRMSGKLNGSVFAHNKGGNYIRSKGYPTVSQSDASNLVRSMFSAVSKLWGQLTEAQREAWRQSTSQFGYKNRLGDQKTLSGFALHQKLNTNLLLVGSAPIQSPPAEAIGAPIPSTVQASSEDGKLNLLVLFDYEPANANSTLMIFATPPLRPGVANFQNELRLLTNEDPADFTPNPGNIYGFYSTKFGTLADGAKIGIGVKVVDNTTGLETDMYTTSTNFVAATP